MRDTYRSIRASAEAEVSSKKSRFVGVAMPIETVEEARQALHEIKRRHYNASHHCLAYRLNPDGETIRASDDGEPNGTAGTPILRQIERLDLTNTLVVVARYFGGIKLGTSGLIRAYGDAAAEVLRQTTIIEHVLRQDLRIHFDYPDTSPAMHVIGKYDAAILETQYDERTALRVAVRKSEVEAFAEHFVDSLSGRAKVEVLGDSE